MRRRGVVHVVIVASLVLVFGSVAAREGAGRRVRPVAAPPPNPGGQAVPASPDSPVASEDPKNRAVPAGDLRPPVATPSQPARAQPPSWIPRVPISFVQRPRPTNAVALTIDDGPNPVWTPQVLDLLARYQVHATFCLIGEEVTRYPDLVRRIATEGHTLCDHTWDHDEQLPSRQPQVIRTEIESAYNAIVQASGGVRPVYYRAPGGNWGGGQVSAEARRLGMTSLNWSVDPRDWNRPGTQRIISTVLDQTQPGDVILMHDGGGNRQESLDALRVILPTLLARGDIFVTP